MADYIRRDDALGASRIVYIEYLETDDDGYVEGDIDTIPVVFKKDIEAIPAADVVEVVRCKDCIYAGEAKEGCFMMSCSVNGKIVSDTDYCSDGWSAWMVGKDE